MLRFGFTAVTTVEGWAMSNSRHWGLVGLLACGLGTLAGCKQSQPAAGPGAASGDTLGRSGGQAGAGLRAGGPNGESGGMMGGMMGRGTARAGMAGTRVAVPGFEASACPPVTTVLVSQGYRIFHSAGNCFACHGKNAKGSPLAPDLTDQTWLNTDGSYAGIATLVNTGVAQPKNFPNPMPAGGGVHLERDQVCALAAYVYSLSH